MELQIAMYIVFLLQHGVLNESDRVIGRVVCLETGDDYTIELGAAEVEQAKQRIRDESEKLRDLLVDRDIARNVPLPIASYPPRPDTDECQRCQFYELCEPQLAKFEYMGPL